MARLTAPGSTAVADVPDELVERYTAAGWVAVKAPKRKKSEDADNE